MHVRPPTAVSTVLILSLVLCAGGVFAQGEDVLPILDTAGFWRMHYTFRLPTVLKDGETVRFDKVAPKKYVPKWIRYDTALPSPGWMKPGFDDGSWVRLCGTLVATATSWRQTTDSKGPFMALVCARGKFNVKDPARARGLTLSVEYRGGVVVYLNGIRIAQAHMQSDGTGGPDEPAKPTTPGEKGNRKLTGIPIPQKHLRKGVNVLALAVHRPPLRMEEITFKLDKWPRGVLVNRAPCALESVRLQAPAAAVGAVVPNVMRPKGFQVWNSNTLAMDFDLDFGDPDEELRPIRIVGTLGGAFSGKVVVGSDREIKGLLATVSELKQTNGRGRIPASAVTIRYARPHGKAFASSFRYLAPVDRLEGLDETPPKTVPVRTKTLPKQKSRRAAQYLISPGVTPVFGAVVPIWVTVQVPTDARPGEYEGTLTITAKGERPVRVPVGITVCGWRMPDPKEYATLVDIIQSPETLAMGYKVPMWSDEHFRLIEKSLRFLGQAGKKTVYIRLICETNLGNAQTMVRWIRNPDGTYRHDFTAFDRYMDLVEKHLGQPPIVCLYMWDKFLGRVASRGQWEGKAQVTALAKVEGKGPEVTLLDPATGEVSKLQLPTFLDPKSKVFWKPLADGICSRMKKRGMSDALMLGIMCDYMPSMETMKALNELFPGAKWVSQAHPWPHKTVASRVGYMSSVHSGDPGNYRDPSIQRLHGWREPNLRTHYWRLTRDNWPVTTFRLMGEMTIMRRYRGFARIGGDFFPVLRDKRGNLVGRIPNRYMKSYWNNLNIEIHLLARGEKGPVATARFEMMREGIQECEARIFIERALADKTLRAKVGEKLADRCQNVLDERTRFIRRGLCSYMASGHYNFWAWQRGGFWVVPTVFGGQWYVASGWQDRSKQLYSTAAHIARALHTVR